MSVSLVMYRDNKMARHSPPSRTQGEGNRDRQHAEGESVRANRTGHAEAGQGTEKRQHA